MNHRPLTKSVASLAPRRVSPVSVSNPLPYRRSGLNERFLKQFLALAALVVFSAFFRLGNTRPLTAHEVLVARTAKEMRSRGDWLIPTYFGEPRLRKPPLAYWETMISFRLFGASEWSARLPSALAGVALTILLTLWCSARYGHDAGLWVGLAQTTSVYVMIQQRLAECDMTLCLAVSLSLLAWDQLDDSATKDHRYGAGDDVEHARRAHAVAFKPWLFHFGLIVAFLAKGPVGPLLIGAVVVADSIVRNRRKSLRSLCRTPLIATTLLLLLPWPMAVVYSHPDAWITWRQETMGRVLADPNGTIRPWLYYPLAMLWLTLPWTPAWLAELVRWVREGRRRQDPSFFPLLWLATSVIALQLSQGKQEHYLMPALPAASILSGLALERLSSTWARRRSPGRRDPLAVATAVAAASIALALTSWEIHSLPKWEEVRWLKSVEAHVAVDRPMIALGHPSQRLSFYLDRALDRRDSLEEFFERDLDRGAAVLTTRATAEAVKARATVEAEFPSTDTSRKGSVLLLLRGHDSLARNQNQRLPGHRSHVK